MVKPVPKKQRTPARKAQALKLPTLRSNGIASTRARVTTLSDREVNDLAQRCREAAIEKKAENVVLLDIRGRANFADYFVLATGRSVIQVRAIADAVVEASEGKYGAPVRTEGYNDGIGYWWTTVRSSCTCSQRPLASSTISSACGRSRRRRARG